MVERPMNEVAVATYAVIERTSQLLKIEQRLPQDEVLKRSMKGFFVIFLAILMPLIIVMLVLISWTIEQTQDALMTAIFWILLILPVALFFLIIIMFFAMRTWTGCTVAEIDKAKGTCTVRATMLDRSEHQRWLKTVRSFLLGYTNELRVMPASELSGLAGSLLKLMSKGMHNLVIISGPQVLPNFIFSDFTPESLLGIKNTIVEFLASR